jgi:ADP-ribose pyrophosphatase YjhB (NUDIX family)
VLGIVVRADRAVLFVSPHEASGSLAHVLIGGRAQANETLEQTLRREVAEETGWVVEPKQMIGFRHFRHLGPPNPALADRPYPDMIQPVYIATPERFDGALLHEGEPVTRFVEGAWALDATEPQQRPLLEEAIRIGARR